jgi:hypothetical protein
MSRAARGLCLAVLFFALMLPTLGITIVHAATLTVTTTADAIHSPGCATDGFTPPCSLRDTILFANANSGTTITLPAGIYTLTILPDANDDATTGDLNLTTSVTINGTSAATTIIQASAIDSSSGIDGVLVVAATDPHAAATTITNVTIRNGRRVGSDVHGGGINIGMFATVTLNNCVISGNIIYGLDASSLVSGGGIENSGTLTLNNTLVSGNAAIAWTGSGGGVEQTFLGGMTVNNSIISGNVATQFGGGIYDLSPGTFALNNSITRGNTANAGGGIFIGIGAKATLENSIISENTATVQGGGLYNGGDSTTVANSTVSRNRVTSPTGFGGGGILNTFHSSLTTTNSTVSGNTASMGGAIANYSGTATISASTIADNSSGIYSRTDNGGGFSLRNSLLANMTGNCAVGQPSPSTAISSANYNLSSDTSCTGFAGSHDLNNVNPLVGPLANNGGPTQTHALLPGSPALDRVPVAGASCPATDQRGIARPQGAACDIGAYEGALNTAPIARPSDPTGPTGPPPAPPPRIGIPPSGAVVNPPAPLPPHR